jgi:putative transposase
MTNAFALLRLPPRSDHDNDTEILVLRHQIAVLQRQLGDQRIRLKPTDRALLAACCALSPGKRRSDCGCWCARTQSCAGTATRSLAAMPPSPAPPPRPTANAAFDPRPGPTTGPWEQQLGLAARPWRPTHPRRESRGLHRLADPARSRRRSLPDRTATTWATFLRSQARGLLAADGAVALRGRQIHAEPGWRVSDRLSEFAERRGDPRSASSSSTSR